MTEVSPEKAPEAAPAASAVSATPAPLSAPSPAPPAMAAAARPPLRSLEPIWTLRKPLPSVYQPWVGMALPILILGLWVGLTSGARPVIGALFLPAPLEVLRVLVRDLFTGERAVAIGQGAAAEVLVFDLP